MKTKGKITTGPVGCKHLLQLQRSGSNSTHSFSITEGFFSDITAVLSFQSTSIQGGQTISLFTSSMIVSRAAPTFFFCQLFSQ